MNHLTLIANLFDRLNHNQLALVAAVDELNTWVELRGSIHVCDNVRAALMAFDHNVMMVRLGVAELIAAAAIEDGVNQCKTTAPDA